MKPRLATALLVGTALLAGCSSSKVSGTIQDPDGPAGDLQLVAFDSCDEAAEDLRAAAREQVGPWGFGDYGPGTLEGDGTVTDELREAAPQAPGAAGPGAPEPKVPEHSGTNVHEAGVDEPDLVKTDGQRIITVAGGTLRVVDAGRQVQTGAVDLEYPGQTADLLLSGDRALVLVEQVFARPLPAEPDRPGVAPDLAGPRLLLVDLTGAPRVVSEYTMDGGLVDARAVGDTVRVVVRSTPRIEFPEHDPDTDEDARVAANREAVDAADLSAWLPRFQVTTGTDTSSGQLDCTAVSRPDTYSGTSMLTVLTFDLAAPDLGHGDPVSVVADGDTVYGNGPSLYVATDQRWRLDPSDDTPEPGRTQIHRFDTSRPGPPVYIGSGGVDGWLINQYAMSDWDGHLRVATTSGDTVFGAEADSESTVYVLDEKLAVVGSVGGLGKGERIYSVRFAGPVGYVVTFRETDPLYTVDLRDPAAPAVLGELKITGYSAYLHPVDGARLIGVGQEADLQGVTQGTQVSLFDVSDLRHPGVQAQHHIPSSSSEAEFDPHAFLWWPAEQLLVLPLLDYYQGSSEALLLRVEDSGITELGRISHPGGGDSFIRRSLVIGDTLWTVSGSGLAAHSLSTLEQQGWVGR